MSGTQKINLCVTLGLTITVNRQCQQLQSDKDKATEDSDPLVKVWVTLSNLDQLKMLAKGEGKLERAIEEGDRSPITALGSALVMAVAQRGSKAPHKQHQYHLGTC